MLIINFEGREVKGLSKGRYDETLLMKMYRSRSIQYILEHRVSSGFPAV